MYRNSNDPNFRDYYKKYCKILSSVIITAKKKYFDGLILKSTNRSRTTWNIVKTVTNKLPISNMLTMNINNKLTTNPSIIENVSTLNFL